MAASFGRPLVRPQARARCQHIQSDWPGSISGSLQLLVFFGRGCEVIRPGLMAEARQRQDEKQQHWGSESSSLSQATRQPTHGDNPLHVGLSRVESAASTVQKHVCTSTYSCCTDGLRGRTRFEVLGPGGVDGVGWVPGAAVLGAGPCLLKNFRSLETRHTLDLCMYIQSMRGRTSHHVQRNQCKST